jgi:hypothetical protein
MNMDGSCECAYPLAPAVCRAFGLNRHTLDYDIPFAGGEVWVRVMYEPCPYCNGCIADEGYLNDWGRDPWDLWKPEVLSGEAHRGLRARW